MKFRPYSYRLVTSVSIRVGGVEDGQVFPVELSGALLMMSWVFQRGFRLRRKIPLTIMSTPRDSFSQGRSLQAIKSGSKSFS